MRESTNISSSKKHNWKISTDQFTQLYKKRGWLNKTYAILSGKASLTTLFTSLSKVVEQSQIDHPSDAKKAIDLKKSVVQSYSKMSKFSKIIDQTFRSSNVEELKKQLLDHTDQKLALHFFAYPLQKVADEDIAKTYEFLSESHFIDIEKFEILVKKYIHSSQVDLWYSEMAAQGYPGASLRQMERCGDLASYEKASQNGILKASLALESAYRNADAFGVEIDLEKAHRYAHRSIQDDQAYIRFAADFITGSGVKKDLLKAETLFRHIIDHAEHSNLRKQARYYLELIAQDL